MQKDHKKQIVNTFKKNGQAMPEFVIIMPVLLFIVLGTLQLAFIYQAKITLNYATFEAARAGSLNKANMFAMESAMARGLAPLYTHDSNYAAFKTAKSRIKQQIDSDFLRIEIINPSPGSYADYARNSGGSLSIPNDNLIYRGSRVGASSEQTIQDANLLKIQAYYCFEMIVPFVNRLIWQMLNGASKAGYPLLKPVHMHPSPVSGTFNEECIVTKNTSGDYTGIPIRSQSIVRMQSPATQ